MAALMTLAEMAASGAKNTNPLELAVIKQTVYRDQFIAQIPTKSVPETTNKYRRESSRALSKIYNVDDTICEGVGKFETVEDEVGRIISQPALDRKVSRHGKLADAWLEQAMSAGWEIDDKLQNQIINGTGDTDGDITGLKELVDDVGSSVKYEASATTRGGAITLVMLDKLRDLVKYPIDCFVTHPSIVTDIKALFQNLGGVDIPQVMRPFTNMNGRGVFIENRPVPSYGGIPIFSSDWMTSETTYGKTGKYRIIGCSLDPSIGLQTFYPEDTALGVTVEPLHMKETKDVKFLRFVHEMGLSLKSTASIGQIVNLRITNS